MLHCRVGIYIGITQNFPKRLAQHKAKKVKSTSWRLPIQRYDHWLVGNYVIASKAERVCHQLQYLKASGDSIYKLLSALSRYNFKLVRNYPDSTHERLVRAKLRSYSNRAEFESDSNYEDQIPEIHQISNGDFQWLEHESTR